MNSVSAKQVLLLPLLLWSACNLVSASPENEVPVFTEDFSGFRAGPISSVVGAHTEYHYLPEAGPKGDWYLSTFISGPLWQLGWRVLKDRGPAEMVQSIRNTRAHTHPMLVTGDEFWKDYRIRVVFSPESDADQSGIVFRYRNDRCYYFFGVEGPKAVLKLVRDETAFRTPYEKILAESECAWKVGDYLDARIEVKGNLIHAEVVGKVSLTAEDSTFLQGKIGLTSDIPTRFRSVQVAMTPEAREEFEAKRKAKDEEEEGLQAKNPKLLLWKKFKTEGVLYDKIKVTDFGVGRNLRFGDLDGDGDRDVLFAQVLHHGPSDRNSEVGCLTAMTFDGDILWQSGIPDPLKVELTNDVGVQIHDLDGDGKNEVVYCRDFELTVAEGATGKTKFKVPMPDTPENTKAPYNRFPKILGDALYFCDLRGTGRDSDVILKNRYQHVWAYDDRLHPLWHGECNTGHYLYAHDVDGDGKEEVQVGYTLFDDDGTKLWSLDDRLQDHADGVAIVNLDPEKSAEPRLLCVGSDEGMFLADTKGNVLEHHYVGHAQNCAVANFRDDLPGLEALSMNFWGNQGIVHFYDSKGKIYHDFEPCQHGSMCLPINWKGGSEEFFVLSPNVEEGGLFDGWGRRVVRFPADGHPDMCNAVLDLTGDCRDEIVVWDPYEVWVYTQDDNPREGKLYKPVRNPLYNFSNYQTTVSLPGWSP